MPFKLTSFIFSMLVLTACSKGDEVEEKGDIVNVWIYDQYDETTNNTIYKRGTVLDENKPGWIFKTDGEMIERANSGDCGTPPIFYADYNNKWELFNDNTIKVDGNFWGGEKDYSIEIISLTSQTLNVKLHY